MAVSGGQEHTKTRPLSGRALDLDSAPVGLGQRPDHAEAQTQPSDRRGLLIRRPARICRRCVEARRPRSPHPRPPPAARRSPSAPARAVDRISPPRGEYFTALDRRFLQHAVHGVPIRREASGAHRRPPSEIDASRWTAAKSSMLSLHVGGQVERLPLEVGRHAQPRAGRDRAARRRCGRAAGLPVDVAQEARRALGRQPRA